MQNKPPSRISQIIKLLEETGGPLGAQEMAQKLDLPEKAFAQKNFHCGNYADSGDLEEILHFQQDSLEDYYRMLETRNTFLSKIFNSLFPDIIKLFLLNQSEPFRASKKKNHEQFRKFFYASQYTT